MTVFDDGLAKAGDATPRVTPEMRDRFRGALLGLAVGDALGAAAEFLTTQQIQERWGVLTEIVGGGCHCVEPGETTDATEMMLCLAESMASCGDFAPEDIMQRYAAWFRSRPKDVSLTVRTVMLALLSGTPWDIASRRAFEILGNTRAGNGSLARCAPVALRYVADGQKRRDTALRESTLTHFDRLAGWACVAFADLLAAACHGRLREQVPVIAAELDDEDTRVSEVLRAALDAEPAEIQSSAFVLDSLKTALWAVLTTDSFEDALIVTANLGNDADTNTAVTGALAGALYGAGAVPPRWTAPLFVHERVLDAADRLADLAAG
jgi:ADP-ribosyl-[dinitrogen reductase] hydrolase